MSEHSPTQYPPPQPEYPPPPPQHPPPPSAPPPPTGASEQTMPQPPPQQPSVSLIERAKANDQEALATMFSQFLPAGETVIDCQYLGVLGLWGIGTHSFAAVTPRRAATLQISLLGGIHYQEGALEYVNSAGAHQPSQVSLYFGIARYALGALIAAIVFGIGVHWAVSLLLIVLAILCVPLYVKYYYRRHKSGVVLWIREGVQVYAFIDRKRMLVANRLYRECMNLREERLRALGHP